VSALRRQQDDASALRQAALDFRRGCPSLQLKSVVRRDLEEARRTGHEHIVGSARISIRISQTLH
jgi:hypothetical protein